LPGLNGGGAAAAIAEPRGLMCNEYAIAFDQIIVTDIAYSLPAQIVPSTRSSAIADKPHDAL